MSKIGNNVNFIGRFTKDPEIRKAGETSVVNFSLARTRDFSKDKDVTDFVDFVAWGKTAETIVKYFKKGNRIGVSGNIQTRTYENNNGAKVKVTEVYVESIEFIDSKSSVSNEKVSDKKKEEPVEEVEDAEEPETSDDDMQF